MILKAMDLFLVKRFTDLQSEIMKNYKIIYQYYGPLLQKLNKTDKEYR